MADKITKDMTLGEVLQKYPDTAKILFKNGLHCIGCQIATVESIEQGCMAHGLDEEKIDAMIKEMNEAVK